MQVRVSSLAVWISIVSVCLPEERLLSQWKGGMAGLANLGLVRDTNVYFGRVSTTVLQYADVGPERRRARVGALNSSC